MVGNLTALLNWFVHYKTFWALEPLDPRFRVMAKAMRVRPDQVDYRESALQLLFYKLCLKMIDHISRAQHFRIQIFDLKM